MNKTVEKDKRYKGVAEADNGAEALEAIEEFSPGIIILAVDMPVMNNGTFDRQTTTHRSLRSFY